MVSLGLLAALSLAQAAPLPSVHAEQAARFGALPPRPRHLTARAVPPPSAHSATVYGYLPYWVDGVTAEELSGLTHVAVFSVGVDADGNLSETGHWTGVASTVVGAAHAAGVKVDLCVTNFDETAMGALLSSGSARSAAVASLASLVNTYGGDGVNVDFEGLPASESANFVTFIRELKSSVDEVYVATPAVDWAGSYDYSALSDTADGLFIMGYDYHYSGGDPGPGDPLYGSDLWGSYALDWTLADYLTYGASPDKIIFGLPLYGEWWPTASSDIPGSATATGSDVLMADALGDYQAYGESYESESHSPYAIYGGGQLWCDDTASMQERVAWALGQGVQGVGFWALGYEDGLTDFWPMMAAETASSSGGGDTDTGSGDHPDTGQSATDTGDTGITGYAPIARAGISFMAYPGDTVVLDGSGSSDPLAGTLTYRWSQVAGATVDLSGGDTATPSFLVTDSGTLTFELVVGNANQFSQPDDVDVVVLDSTASKGGGCATGSGGGWAGVVLALGVGIGARRRR